MISEIQWKGGIPVRPAAREEYLANNIRGYKAVTYINEHTDQNEAVYIIGPSWLNYYLKPQVVDSNGLLHVSYRPVFRWPDDIHWLRRMEMQNVAWILIDDWSMPKSRSGTNSDRVTSFWPGYSLVYADSQMWVFRRQGRASN